MEPVDQWYGIREFAVQDPFGIILIFAQILEQEQMMVNK